MLAGAARGHGEHAVPATASPLAPGYSALGFEPPAPGSYQLPILGVAADGEVLDTSGRAWRLHELYAGKLVLLAFIYTHCDDVNGCPLATHVLARAQLRIAADPALRDAVRTLSLSFDPQRDTPAVLARYSAAIRRATDWRFVTARSETELAPLLAGYDQAVRPDIDADGRRLGTFSHVLRVFLIDREQRIRNIYSASFLHADTVLADLRTLLLDTPQPPPVTAARSAAVDLQAISRGARFGLPVANAMAGPRPSAPMIALGRKLFFDRRLSHNGTLSCALCHVPEQGFTRNDMRTAVGIEGRSVRRNAPTLYNVALAQSLFHDGRESRLERQVWGPLLAVNEMGNPSPGYVIDKLAALPDYRGLFQAAFAGRGPDMETIGVALASYERMLLAGNSAFDRWYYGKEPDALGAAAIRGFGLFTGTARCSVCHTIDPSGALLADGMLHNTGVGYARSMAIPDSVRQVQVAPDTAVTVAADVVAAATAPAQADLGRYEITLDPADRWKYRTPTLRNVALTAPYMHDGSLPTLRSVVEFYNRGGIANENLDPLLAPLGLSRADVEDLVAFLESLTGASVDAIVADARAAPIGNPQ